VDTGFGQLLTDGTASPGGFIIHEDRFDKYAAPATDIYSAMFIEANVFIGYEGIFDKLRDILWPDIRPVLGIKPAE
jgi:hypothetical protein